MRCHGLLAVFRGRTPACQLLLADEESERGADERVKKGMQDVALSSVLAQGMAAPEQDLLLDPHRRSTGTAAARLTRKATSRRVPARQLQTPDSLPHRSGTPPG